jgi:hemoglobin
MTDVTTTADQRRAEARADLATATMYALLGGAEGVRAIVDRFDDLMDTDAPFATIRSMHQPDLTAMRASLFEYLSGWLGGPPLYVQRHGSPCIAGAHAPYAIGQDERDLWLVCMDRALTEVDVPLKYRELLLPAFAGVADMLRNDR